MSIDDRKDVRCKLAPDLHSALTALAEISGKEIGEYAASVLSDHINAEVTRARLVLQRVERLGISGKGRA